MNTETLPVMVTGTGTKNHANAIRRCCDEGMPVELRRERENVLDPEAISVWIRCGRFLWFFKAWTRIGYVKVPRGSALDRKLNVGSVKVKRATVRSFFAPLDREEPQVALQVELEVDA